jgi:hypothetical protein
MRAGWAKIPAGAGGDDVVSCRGNREVCSMRTTTVLLGLLLAGALAAAGVLQACASDTGGTCVPVETDGGADAACVVSPTTAAGGGW